MPDSDFAFPLGLRVIDADVLAVSGGKLKFFLAGTTTPTTVYSDTALSASLGSTVYCDAGGHPVASEGSTTKVAIYIGTSSYKLVVTDADDVEIATYDNVKAALNTSSFSSGSGSGITGVDTGSTDYTIDADDDGKLFRRDPTSGDVTITFPDATSVDIGDGFTFGIQHSGTTTTNRVKFQSVLSQTIEMEGKSVLAGALTGGGETLWFVCDGAGWQTANRVPPLSRSDVSTIRVKSRLAAPPTSPTAGARYILQASPSGAWASYAEHDVVEATGIGTWTKWTPPTDCGALAYIEDENLYTSFQGSAWVDLSSATLPTQVVSRAVYQHITAQNTAASTLTASSWQTVPWTTEQIDTIGITLSSNQITPPEGTFRIDIRRPFTSSGSPSANGVCRLRLKNATSSAIVAYGDVTPITNSSAGTATLVTDFEANGTDAYVVEVYGSVGLVPGGVQNLSGITENHGTMELTDLAGVRGATGVQGVTGADGADAGWKYTWSSDTSSSDPSSGGVKGNNATLGSITALYISETDADSNGIADEIATWDDSTSTTAARSTIKLGNAAGMILFKVDGANTDNGSWVTLTGSVVASRGSLTGTVRVAPALTGDKGDTGATGDTGPTGSTGATGATGPNTGLDYAFATATSGDPGSGKLLFDSATLSSVTQVNISETGRNSEALAAVIATWDDSTNTAHYGHLRIFDVADRTKFLECEITGTITDAGAYRTIPVTYTAGGTLPSANAVLAVMFERTGNKGADGAGTGDVSGPASSVDDELALFDSTTGKLIKRASLTGLVKATSGVASAATAGTDYLAPPSGTALLKANSGGALANATAGTDYLAPPTGTALLKANSGGALANAAAGTDYVAATSGSAVQKADGAGGLTAAAATDLGAGTHTIYVPATAMIARTTNGAAAGTVETTTNKVMLKTLDFDTTTQEFAQFSIRMPKSWNESTVTAAFAWSHASTTTNFGVVWALEGVALSDGDAGDTAFGTAQQIADTGGTTDDIYVTSATPAMTIGGTPAAEDWVVFQVKRLPSDASDTMAVDARLHGVTLYITTDAITDA